MFEFYGWVKIVADDRDDADVAVKDARRMALCNAVEKKIKEVERINCFFKVFRNFNGQSVLLVTGFPNRRYDPIVGFFHWIAKNQPFSYGLLHIRDDEDVERGFDNVVRTYSLAQGCIGESTEERLSPCIPTIEPERPGHIKRDD